MAQNINIQVLTFDEAIEFTTSINFFTAEFIVASSFNSIWNFLSDIRNILNWHPFMFELSASDKEFFEQQYAEYAEIIQNPTDSLAVYRNIYVNRNFSRVLVLDKEIDDIDAKFIECHAYGIEETNYTGYNYFTFQFQAIDSGNTKIIFSRYVNPNLPLILDDNRRGWYNMLVDIAYEITESLNNYKYL